MSQILPGNVYIFNIEKNIWEMSSSEDAEVFYYAMLNIPPHGIMMYELINKFYTTDNGKYSMYHGTGGKWYIQGPHSNKVRQIMRIDEGDDIEYIEKLEHKISIDNNN